MIQISEKFEKELCKFNEWLECSGYRIRTEDGGEGTWGLQLLNDFKEQGRNKLDHYLKELMKMYTISREDEIVEDYKLVVKEFKEFKPKGTRKAKTDSREIRPVLYNEADISKLYAEVTEMKKQMTEMMKRLEGVEGTNEKIPVVQKVDRSDQESKSEAVAPEMSDLFGEIDLGDISDIDFDD